MATHTRMCPGQASIIMAVLFLILFTCWSVEATSFEPVYALHKHMPDARISPIVQVMSLETSKARVKRQSPSSPDAATTPGSDPTPDSTNQQSSPDQPSGGNSTASPASPANPTQAPGTNVDSTENNSSSNSNNQTSTLPPTTTTGPDPFANATEYEDSHVYYTSAVSNNVDDDWVELENATRHVTLSTSHRLAAVIDLEFPFYFYGHEVWNVTVATGGFIYMSKFLHMWLTATQYVAPLMANFDPKGDANSHIYYKSTKDKFTVEWKDVLLQDQTNAGRFHFQAVLHKNSSIEFLYKTIPIPVSQISTKQHPVKVGLSDAWYNDTLIQNTNVMRRTIIEYHRVSLNFSLIRSGSRVMIHALPTCNRLTSCDTCTAHANVSFDCKWCNKIARCSDGLDWFRQHWTNSNCGNTGGDCDDDKGFPAAAIVIIVLFVLALVVCLGGWIYYAYTHPTSRSGMWLMEHRPSQIKAKIKFWKSSTASGAKYQVETDA